MACRGLPAALVVLALAAPAAHAAAGGAEAPAEAVAGAANPPAEALEAEALDRATRASLARGVGAILAVLRDEENESRLVFEPIYQRKVVRTEEVEAHFRREVVRKPKWKYHYEEVEVLKPVRDGSQVRLERVKERRLVRREQIGWQEEERLVPDPDGDVVLKRHRRIYGPGGPDLLPSGTLGANGMALYVLLACGVSPEDEPALEDLAWAVDRYLSVFGVPDYTWDVAWLAMAYACYPGDRFDAVARRLVTKLALGQIADGPARGLWGPVCINTALLARMLENEARLSADIKKAEALLAQNPGNPVLERKLAHLKGLRNDLGDRIKGVARQGLRFEDCTRPYRIKDEFSEFGRDVQVPGLAANIYREALADIGSTALALRALRVAGERGLLPEEVTAEVKDARGQPLVPPEPMTGILARSAAALASAQQSDGSWDETNRWQACHHFDRFGLGNLGEAIRIPDETPSRARRLATAEGYAALSDIAAIVGRAAVMRKHGAAFEKGRSAVLEAAEGYLAGLPEPDEVDEASAGLPDGGPAEGFALAFRLTAADRLHGAPVRAGEGLRRRLAYRLLRQQGKDGLWGAKGRGANLATSTRERFAELVRSDQRELFFHERRVPAKWREADAATLFPQVFHHRLWWLDGWMLATLYGMLGLLEDVRPPVGGAWVGAELPPAQLLGPAVREISVSRGVRVSLAALGPAADPPDAGQLGVVVLACNRPFADLPEGAAARLRGFVEGGRLVVVEVEDSSVGRQFLTDARDKLFGGLGLEETRLGADHALTNGILAGGSASLELALSGGQPAVVYLVVTHLARPRPGTLSTEQAGRIVARLLLSRTSERVLDAAYPISLEGEGSPEAVFQAAMDELAAAVEYHRVKAGAEQVAPPPQDETGAKKPSLPDEPPPAPRAPDETF